MVFAKFADGVDMVSRFGLADRHPGE